MANPQLNKSALVDDIANRVDGVSKKQINDVVDAFVERVTESVAGDVDVSLAGLGRFTRTERAARTGRNPQTGESIQIAASKNPGFKPAKPFKDLCNR